MLWIISRHTDPDQPVGVKLQSRRIGQIINIRHQIWVNLREAIE